MTVLQRYLDRKVQPDMFATPAPSYDEFAGPQGVVREGWAGLAEGLRDKDEQISALNAQLASKDTELTGLRAELAAQTARLDAEAEGADWAEVARIVLHIDPAREPERARRAWETHLARAKWMTNRGFRHLLRGPPN